MQGFGLWIQGFRVLGFWGLVRDLREFRELRYYIAPCCGGFALRCKYVFVGSRTYGR